MKGLDMTKMIGVEVRRKTIQETEYVCPRCGVDRMGSEVEPQRWFRIARLPIIPLATMPNEIMCGTCGHRSDLGVLEIPTTAQLTEYLEIAVRCSIAYVVRSGRANAFDFHIDPAVVALAVAVMHADGQEYDVNQLHHDVAHLDDDDARASLGRLMPEMTSHGKQGFLHRMAAIALADGPMNVREHRSLAEIGVALGMSAPHINGILAVAALEFETA
jgi:hypothetical protein